MAGTITALVVQQRNKQRINVYLDGEFAFGLTALEALKLHKGQRLSDEDIARLRGLDAIEVAHERALDFLAYRPRSIAEVRQHLRGKDFSPEAIETAITRLERAGLLDDEAFARYWVENRQQFKPLGARALRYELRQKGVADPVIAEALADLSDDQAAYQAAQARAQRYADADEQTFRKRLGDFLTRRGFGYRVVRDTLDRLWHDLEAERKFPAPDDPNLGR
jgi:regulatory protein